MDIILSEQQYKKLLIEEKQDEITETFKESKSFIRKVISDVKKQHGIDFSFALTWGSAIGGFIGPVSRYMENKYVNLSESDITLLTFACILTYFSSNKEKLNTVLSLIKERKLITYFNQMMMKSDDLKTAFFEFLGSLNITLSKVSNMLAYTFLVPLIPMLKHVADMDISSEEINLIVKSVSGYTAIITSSAIVKDLIENIIERFKS